MEINRRNYDLARPSLSYQQIVSQLEHVVAGLIATVMQQSIMGKVD